MNVVGPQDPLLAEVRALMESAVAVLPVRILHLEWSADRHLKILRVYIERRNDGEAVTVADCANASHAIDLVLEAQDPVTFAYNLEVSSPGVDRPLVRPEDFQKYCGFVVNIESVSPIDGRKKFHGRLEGFSTDEIDVKVDGKSFHIPLQAIKKARLDYFASKPEEAPRSEDCTIEE